MSEIYSNESMLDMYLFETEQLLEDLEQSIINSEKVGSYSSDAINEIFRFMHTIKGSSNMMLFNNIGLLAHSIEDLFFFLREQSPDVVDYSKLSDLVLEGVDFIKIEVAKIKNGDEVDGNANSIINEINDFLKELKNNNSTDEAQTSVKDTSILDDTPTTEASPAKTSTGGTSSNNFKAKIYFEDDCEMENLRAYTVINDLAGLAEAEVMGHTPEKILEDDNSSKYIQENGFEIIINTEHSYEEMHEFFMKTMFLKDLELEEIIAVKEIEEVKKTEANAPQNNPSTPSPSKEHSAKEIHSAAQKISVSVDKLDTLMDLAGEMVIAEAMVTQNPDLIGLELDNFNKASRQLRKITNELQDIVMSIRMVPLSTTFMKMHRIVRDMCKKLDKTVDLVVIGEETEVDKNIIEHISDPLMHIIRNSVDHGIESSEERINKGKDKTGTVTLEAKNSGSDVLVIVRDDGKGLNRDKLIKKAKENGILTKNENEMSDKEVYNLILAPGFSTKEKVTEFSGRGVGMDVVAKNIEKVGGSVNVDSIEGQGMTITLKIPLTLAIIDGMNIKVGNSKYTIPITAIKESFRPKDENLVIDPEGNEMIMVRGLCYPILRLHKYYNVETEITDFKDGILIMVEQGEDGYCIFADELLGKQQVVVKALPNYIKRNRDINGLSGCTLLGDGSISLILDIGTLV